MNEENNTVNVLGNNEVSNKLDTSENQKIENNINIIEDQNVNINIISQSDLSEKLSPSLSIIDRGQENEISSNVETKTTKNYSHWHFVDSVAKPCVDGLFRGLVSIRVYASGSRFQSRY